MAHWYIEKNGIAQRYEQLTKKGEPSKRINRGKALKDGAVPGTTDTLKVLGSSDGLLHWVGALGIQAGLESHDEDQAKELLKELREKAANRGTEIHNAIEQYIKTGDLSDDPVERKASINAVACIGDVLHGWSEHCFVWRGYINILTGEHSTEKKGKEWIRVAVGGTSDYVSDSLIADWKTVEDKGRGFRQSYAKEAAQCAMYRLGFGRHDAVCKNIYIDRATGDVVRVKEWTETELRNGLRLFAMAVLYSTLEERIEK